MKKQVLSLVLAAAMTVGLASPALAAEETESGKIVILHTNDVHCGIDPVTDEESGAVTNVGYAGVAAYKAEMEAQYGAENVTLVDAGDAIQGGPIGTLSKGSYIVDIMNQVGYDLAIPGNHEFDYGMENFLSLATEKASYSYLCCNFTDLEGNPILDGYQVVDYGDVRVGYVGIDTPESFTKSTPTYFQDAEGNYIYSFCQGNEGKDLYAAVQEAVDAAVAEGADYVVALGHLGNEGSTDVWTSKAVIANTTGIDVFIDGHSHESYAQTVQNKDGEEVALAQTGTKLASIGKVVIDTATGAITTELVSGYEGQDETVAAYVADVNEAFAAVLQEVVATSDVTLTTLDPATGQRAVRNAETNLGDLCADAYRVMLGADVAFVNGGGVRADIAAGDITYEDIINVHPFGNEACLVETTGQDILDALEMGARLYPEENGGFLQVSGLSYTIDAGVPSSVVLSDEGEFVKVDGPYRVKDVLVDGTPLDVTKTYTLASHNYMLKSGGDGFVMFKDDTLLKDSVMIDNAVLINYIVDELDGVVGSDYAAPQGRITVEHSDPGDVWTDLEEGAWYAEAVDYVIGQGIMGSVSTSANVFSPNGIVTRATVYQTIYNMEGKPAVGYPATFSDVVGTWYATSAAWAEDTGLTTGDGTGAYAGDRAVTRAELATIFARYAQMKGLATTAGDLSSYADADDVAGWATEGMTVAVGSGILRGKPGNLLDPNGTAVRTELATIHLNFSKLSPAVLASMTGTIQEVEKYGHVVLDLTIADFEQAGYALGDTVNVVFDNGYTLNAIPYFNGYYVESGAPMLRAYPGDTYLGICINYGKLNETAGVDVGNTATISLAVKGAEKDTQELNSLVYTDDRSDYDSDAEFANFRAVVVGDIAEGILYRSASPVNDEHGRASYADALIQQAGVKTVLNLADSTEDIDGYLAAEGFHSPYYKGLYEAGSVIALSMPVDYASESFGKDLTAGLIQLSGKPGPYLVHCTEGKDRAGFTSALLECLMGASLDEVVADYMRSYENYYGVTQVETPEKYQLIVENNILEMLRTIAGVEEGTDLSSVDLQSAAEDYLTGFGMTQAQLAALQANLSAAPADKAA